MVSASDKAATSLFRERCTAVFCAWPWGPLGEKQQKNPSRKKQISPVQSDPPNSERAPREHHGGTAGAPREHCSRGAPAVNNIACVLGGVADRAPPFFPSGRGGSLCFSAFMFLCRVPLVFDFVSRLHFKLIVFYCRMPQNLSNKMKANRLSSYGSFTAPR